MDARRVSSSMRLLACVGVTVVLFAAGAWAADTCPSEGQAAAPKAGVDGWQSLFNGKDLTGWEPTGKADWKVVDKCLVGRQGPNNAPGDLFTKEEFADFELTVTYKIQWPANSGVWFRYQTPDRSYQADILEYTNPVCYSGTLYCPGKMFLSMNENPARVKRDDWNTMKILAQGEHLVITLNGTVTGDVHEASFDKGKIGFQIHPGAEFKDMQITVREMLIHPLPLECSPQDKKE